MARVAIAGKYILFALPVLFLALFFVTPLVGILREGLAPEGTLNLAVFGNVLASASFWRLLWFTTWQAAASTALTLLVGLPMAAAFARYDFRGKTFLRALTTIPFVMPTVVVAAAFSMLVGPGGVANTWLRALFGQGAPTINLQQTIWLILLAHVFYNVSVVIRTVGGFWESLNPALTEAGRVLGAHGLRLFRTVTLPLLVPSITAAGLLIFLFCFTSFGVVLILGGLRYATIEVEIYRQAISYFNLPVAAALCLIQMALTFIVMSWYTRVQARAALPLEMRPEMSPEMSRARHAHGWRQRAIVVALLVGTVLMLIAPLLALAWRSFTLGGNGFTTQFYTALSENPRQSAFFVPPLAAVRNSVLYASATTMLSLLLGVSAAYLLTHRRNRLTAVLDPLFLLPLGTSAVTLGFGFIVTMGAWLTSFWLVPVAHTLIAMPFVIRTFLPALRSVDPRLREAAAVLGAPPAQVWRSVDLPILRRALLVAAAFAFTISLGEFGATLLISRPETPTMPVVIYRYLGQPGLLNYGQALAMSTILMVVCALALVLIERFRLPGEEI